MDLRSSSITADILNFISDGKLHKMQDIANEVEVSERTIRRHIQSLSYRYPIEVFVGGRDTGGVRLDPKYIVQGKILTNDKLQLINHALNLLQEVEYSDNPLLKELIKDFSLPTKNQENKEHENTN